MHKCIKRLVLGVLVEDLHTSTPLQTKTLQVFAPFRKQQSVNSLDFLLTLGDILPTLFFFVEHFTEICRNYWNSKIIA